MKMDVDTDHETSTSSFYEPITPASLLSTLDQFLYLSSNSNDRKHFPFSKEKTGNPEQDEKIAVQSALFLLQNLPSARTAALAFLGQALSKQVWEYMQRKTQSPSITEESLVNQVEILLGELVETSPAVWGPLVARWAVNQLGRWSVEWDGVILGRNTTLEERVAGWLNCAPARAMANLTVSCVAHEADNTVAALLEASVHNGPVLNWLVAHVGCSFPATIVNRVLSLGLRSFVTAVSSSQASHQLNSVDIILNHLAERYFAEIECELQAVLLSSFTEPPNNFTKAIVPFLLQLASANRSKAVLRALTSCLPKVMQQKNIPSFANQLAWWIPKYFPTSESLIDLLVHLLLDTGGPVACEIVCLLVQGSLSSDAFHGNFTSKLLHYLLAELGSIAYMRRTLTPLRPLIPLLSSLGSERKTKKGSNMTISDLIDWAIEVDKELAVRRLGQVLTYVLMEQGPESASFIFKNVLFSNSPISQNSMYLLHCLQCAIVSHQSLHNAPTKTLTKVLGDNIQWNVNLGELSSCLKKWEFMLIGGRINKSHSSEALISASLQNIHRLSKLINVHELSDTVLEIIIQLPLEKPMVLGHMFTLSHAVTFYFFSCLKKCSTEEKIKKAHVCNKILSQLSHSSLGHSLIVRLLFESSYSQEWAYLFGAKDGSFVKTKEVPFKLLQANHQFDSWVKVPQSHNTIFHAGQIGSNGANSIKKIPSKRLDKEDIVLNCQLLLNLLAMTCRSQGLSQGATTIALLLVEFVSPDIMFNGFPWPEENIKFTFERDLTIKRTFESFPITWHYLELVARCRPALCYCSVLVRALTAALTAFWNTCSRNLASQSPDQLFATKKLLEVMVVGQFLPEVFSALPQMVDQLAPYEVVMILQDVWVYLRDNTPSPDRWTISSSGVHSPITDPIDPRYTDRCRKLIHAHIAKFGHLLPLVLKL